LTTATGCPPTFAFAFLPFKQFQCSFSSPEIAFPFQFHWQNPFNRLAHKNGVAGTRYFTASPNSDFQLFFQYFRV